MKVFRALGRTIKPLVNFPKWMGLPYLVDNARAIKYMGKQLALTTTPEHQETFEEAKARQGLTDQALKSRARQCKFLALLFSAVGVASLCYAFLFHLARGHILAMCMTLMVAAIALCQAFRNHFWYFQIKQQRLGCSVREWFSYLLGKRG